MPHSFRNGPAGVIGPAGESVDDGQHQVATRILRIRCYVTMHAGLRAGVRLARNLRGILLAGARLPLSHTQAMWLGR